LYLELCEGADRTLARSPNLGSAGLWDPRTGIPAHPLLGEVVQRRLGRLRRYALPLELRGEAYLLVAAGPVTPAAQGIGILDRVLLLAAPLMLILLAGAGYLMAAHALLPVGKITAAAREIRAGDMRRRIALAGPRDELVELADAFDEMIGALERLIVAQRQFLADASHGLRTPLTVVLSAAEVGLREHPGQGAPQREALAAVYETARRMKRLVDDLMLLARADMGDQSLRKEVVDLGAFIRRTAA